MIDRRKLLGSAGAFAAAGIAGSGYSLAIEPHWIEFTEHDLPVKGLPKDWWGRTLIQLTDIHVGPRVDDGYLKGVFADVTRLQPDLVVYTGDFITLESGIHDHLRAMSAHFPKGRLGTFGSLGNHDWGKYFRDPDFADAIEQIATKAGITMLRNATAEVDGLTITGLEDLWGQHFNESLIRGLIADSSPHLVLSHNPDTADLELWSGFKGWILSGHTHGGQVTLPFFDPPVLPVENRRYTAGKFDLFDGRNLYISRGIGHGPQIRFNVRPEVTIHRLHPATF